MDALNLEFAKQLAPLSYDRAGYIWGRSEKGGRTVIANIRGWGYLTGQGAGALALNDATAVNRQLAWCEMICASVNMAAGLVGDVAREDQRSDKADADG